MQLKKKKITHKALFVLLGHFKGEKRLHLIITQTSMHMCAGQYILTLLDIDDCDDVLFGMLMVTGFTLLEAVS